MTAPELVRELQGARPLAPDALRERVRSIATREPVARPSLATRLRFRPRLLAAVPACAVAVAVVAGVVGLSRAPSVQQAGPIASADATTSGTELQTAPATAKESAAPPAVGAVTGSGPGPTTGRAQRYQAELAIQVKDGDALSAATQRALTTVRSLGGYVVSVSYASAESGAAQLTLRVPTDRVQQAIVGLSSLGTIVSQRVQIDDLQGTLDETAAQIDALREQIARLDARLASSTLPAATRATLEARRSEARRQLATLRAQRSATAQEAAFATIQLSLATPNDAGVVPAAPTRIDRALDDAKAILVWEATALVYLLLVAGPIALLAAGAWLLARALRRRADERLLT
jgi:hypothetical protein